MITIEILRSRLLKQKYHFRFVAPNGKILASSERYNNLIDCEHAARLINPNLKIEYKF